MVIKSGNIGIGNINPTAKLDIAGSIKITDGTQGVGKVLTSDTSGQASWQNPNSGGPLASRPTNPTLYSTYLVTDDGGPYLSIFIGNGVWKKIMLE